MEQYQDIWVKGSLKSKGVRECESRWEMIREYAEEFKRPFTVLDLGANLGYFSLRLAETFDCTVVAIEGIYGKWLQSVLNENGNNRVLLLNKTFSLKNLRDLSQVEHFDLTLALSVIHHIGAKYEDSLEVLRSMGSALIMEIATESNACGQSIVKTQFMPDDAEIIGYGKSHLGGNPRPVFLLEQEKTKLDRAYLNSPLDDVDLEIVCDAAQKCVRQRGVERPWYRGINLKTFLTYNGVYPSMKKVRELVEAAKPTTYHGDIMAHNIILQGDAAQFIDANDERRRNRDDETDFKNLMLYLENFSG